MRQCKRGIGLTKDDWTEIFYALQYKRDTSPAVQHDKRWTDHLDKILKKIGPDGERALAADKVEYSARLQRLLEDLVDIGRQDIYTDAEEYSGRVGSIQQLFSILYELLSGVPVRDMDGRRVGALVIANADNADDNGRDGDAE